ncbi:winged helix DNA-binding protein [Collinsella sp. AGMB00827]|uniref:Winged helix DNA-binding protein n=1 Tax=Collinsella ureilytica TaxID=2869515 RepID=A0ABS7MKB1_9ACTN|nr:MarR family transcriptional regulator [Collinsella urealyticum]MBY4797707.1 winged helix DNA-binding protein [Collinsella urealyticum]
MKHLKPIPNPAETPEEKRALSILELLGFCGHYLHFRVGGRSGQSPILCLLALNGGRLSQREIGLNFDLKPGSLSEILTKLEAAGLVERERVEADRRQRIVKLTEEGAVTAEREMQARRAFRNRAFAVLSTEEQEQLIALLGKVRTSWEEQDD